MIDQISHYWHSQTLRLACVYLAIVMSMALIFSVVVYNVSASHIEDRTMFFEQNNLGVFEPSGKVDSRYDLEYAKKDLVSKLVLINGIILIFGGAISLVLARWTLDPIEKNVEAQTRFVSDASHELRTPLAAIQTTNEVALRRKKISEKEARRIINSNLEDVQRLQRMTSMLLQIVNSDRVINSAPTEVRMIVSRSLSDIAPKAIEKKITINDQLSGDFALAEEESASQAITILLDNAVKYSNRKDEITVSSKKRRSQIVISIQDNGPGISKEDQKKIFSRFYRTDEARARDGSGGYGLGLEIAQKIAELHGGSIELRSSPGKGSTFSLVLPLAKAKTSRSQSKDTESESN